MQPARKRRRNGHPEPDAATIRDYLMVILSLVALAVLVAAFFGLMVVFTEDLRSGEGWWFATGSLLVMLIPNLLAVVLVYLLIEFLLRRRGLDDGTWVENRLVTRIADAVKGAAGVKEVAFGLGDVRWKDYFTHAKKVDIVTRFSDGVLQHQVGQENLVQAFRDGLTVRLATFDEEDPDTLATVEQDRTAVASTMGITSESVKSRQSRTVTTLENARTTAGAPPSAVEVYQIKRPLNYTGYCFDNRLLVYLPEEHVHTPGVRPPQITLDLVALPQALKFWEAEWKYFTQQRKATSPSQDQTPAPVPSQTPPQP